MAAKKAVQFGEVREEVEAQIKPHTTALGHDGTQVQAANIEPLRGFRQIIGVGFQECRVRAKQEENPEPLSGWISHRL